MLRTLFLLGLVIPFQAGAQSLPLPFSLFLGTYQVEKTCQPGTAAFSYDAIRVYEDLETEGSICVELLNSQSVVAHFLDCFPVNWVDQIYETGSQWQFRRHLLKARSGQIDEWIQACTSARCGPWQPHYQLRLKGNRLKLRIYSESREDSCSGIRSESSGTSSTSIKVDAGKDRRRSS